MRPKLLYYIDVGVGLECLQPEPVFADADWLEHVLGSRLCPNCRCVNRSTYPEPLNVTLANPPEAQTAALVELTNVMIWRKDFIVEKLGLRRDFVFGECSLPDGTVIEDYVTCYRQNYIVARGGQNSKYRICSKCGVVISEVRTGLEYILERYLSDSSVFQDALCRFFLAPEVAFPHNYKHWEDVTLKAINIREEPNDGLTLPGD